MRNLWHFLLGVCLISSPVAFSQNNVLLPDSVGRTKLTYRIGQNAPDMTVHSNKVNLSSLIRNLKAFSINADSVAVDITYFSGPGAVNSINRGIGDSRAAMLIKDLVAKTGLPDSVFYIIDGEEGWAELLSVISSSDINDAEAVVEIINGDPAKRLSRLKKLNKGKTYAYLKETVFPELRGRVNVTFGSPAAVDSVLSAVRMIELGINNRDKTCGENCVCAAKIQALSPHKPVVYPEPAGFSYAGDFAIKTNLIYDFVTVPSIELEYRFHNNWSAALEYDMAWWKNKRKNKCFELALVSPEVRWWFPTATPLKGYYVGAFPGYTWYDFENGGTGHRGSGVFGGISFGLSHPISSQVAFEAGLGVGYMNLRYKDYEPVDGHHVYSREKTTGYFGPLKIKFAIVWHPWGGETKKGKGKK